LDRVIAELAERQHGILALAQLRELGLSASGTRERVRTGRLRRIYRGVYSPGHSVLTREGRWMAAVLASGPGAVLSHRSAAALLGLRRDSSSVVDVTTPAAGLRRTGRVIRHRGGTLRAKDVTVVDGIPCTSVARTLLDLAEVVDRQALRRACSQAEVLRSFDGRAVEDVLDRAAGRKGAPLLRELLSEGRITEAITRNKLEERFLALCDQVGLPLPRVNAWIPLGSGGVEADFLWENDRLVVETDGRGVHDTSTAFEADRRRDQRLLAAGYRVVRFTWAQVMHEPAGVVEVLGALLTRLPSSGQDRSAGDA
jgi:Protein of unknown function (DUF559)/Transcriptional regulator, AbiEi antitoxin